MPTFELTYAQIDDIIISDLKDVVLATNKDEGGNDITDYVFKDHAIHVLKYYMLNDQFKTFCEENGIDVERYK